MEDEGSSLHTSSDGSDVELEMTRDDDDDGDPSRNNKQKRKKKEPTNIIRFIWWKTVQNEIYSVLAFSATSESNPSNKKQE